LFTVPSPGKAGLEALGRAELGKHLAGMSAFTKQTQLGSESFAMSFFEGLFGNYRRQAVFFEDFQKHVLPFVKARVHQALKPEPELNSLWFTWDKANSRLGLGLNLEKDAMDFLNQDAATQKKTKAALQAFYRYSGPFTFEFDDVPF
jgi:hypothetical protein